MSTSVAQTTVSLPSTRSAFSSTFVHSSLSIPGRLRGSDGRMLEVVNMTSAMRAGSQAGEVEQTSDTIESLRAQLQSALAEKQFALSLFAMSKCELDEARNEVAKTVELLQEAQKEMQAVYKGYMEISAQLERLKKGEFCLYVVPALYECRGEGRSDCGAFKR